MIAVNFFVFENTLYRDRVDESAEWAFNLQHVSFLYLTDETAFPDRSHGSLHCPQVSIPSVGIGHGRLGASVMSVQFRNHASPCRALVTVNWDVDCRSFFHFPNLSHHLPRRLQLPWVLAMPSTRNSRRQSRPQIEVQTMMRQRKVKLGLYKSCSSVRQSLQLDEPRTMQQKIRRRHLRSNTRTETLPSSKWGAHNVAILPTLVPSPQCPTLRWS